MHEAFDPYHKWLGIPPAEQPPDHYRLLGLSMFEDDAAVIESSADRQMTHVRTFQSGPNGASSQRLLNEIAAARLCLLKPQRKLEYDQALRERLAAPPANAIVAVQPAPSPAGMPAPIAPPMVVPPVAVAAGRDAVGTASVLAGRRRRGMPVAPVAAAVVVLAVVAGLLIAAGLREPALQQASVDHQPAAGVDDRGDEAPVPRVLIRVNPADEPQPAVRPVAFDGTSSSRTVHDAQPGESSRATVSTKSQPSAPTPAPRPVPTRITPPPASPAPPSTSPASASSSPDLSLPKTQPSTPRRPSKVHKDAIHFDGNWYLFSEEKAGFVQAFATAKRFRGRMVVINSPEENAFVASQVKGPTWLGMERQGTVWMNAMQKPQAWFNWDRGQPQSNPREVFAAIHQSGRWHDYLPDKLYLCIEWGDE